MFRANFEYNDDNFIKISWKISIFFKSGISASAKVQKEQVNIYMLYYIFVDLCKSCGVEAGGGGILYISSVRVEINAIRALLFVINTIKTTPPPFLRRIRIFD